MGMTWPEDTEAMAGVESGTCVPCDEVESHAEATLCCGREAHYRVHFQNPKKPAQQPVYEAKSAGEFGTFAVGQIHELSIDGEKVVLAKDEP
jgi:hypothetical protein